MIRRWAVAGLLSVALAGGCGGPAPSPSAPAAPSAEPSGEPSVPAGSGASPMPAPGRPLDATAILEAMRASRRPGGVPEELQARGIAASIAEAVWTFDGEAWNAVTAGGACGPQRCTLELLGSRDDAAGTDAWAFAIDPASGTVEIVEHTLAALPERVVAELDGLAHAGEELDGLVLGSARWLGPEAPARFELGYRRGDEEESCSVDVTVDLTRRQVVDVARAGC